MNACYPDSKNKINFFSWKFVGNFLTILPWSRTFSLLPITYEKIMKYDIQFWSLVLVLEFLPNWPCPKVFLPTGKNLVKSPVITTHSKNIATLLGSGLGRGNGYQLNTKGGQLTLATCIQL